VQEFDADDLKEIQDRIWSDFVRDKRAREGLPELPQHRAARRSREWLPIVVGILIVMWVYAGCPGFGY
jgi:hypothetical protein